MPTFLLYIKATLENVSLIQPEEHHRWCLTVKESAGSETRSGVYVSSADTHDLSGSRGTANLALKFAKDSRHEASLNILSIKGVTRSVTEEDDNKWVPVVAFECRGLEPTEFSPEDGWIVKSTGKKVFTDVDLSEKEWCDFDEDEGCSVGIYEFESKIELYKGK